MTKSYGGVSLKVDGGQDSGRVTITIVCAAKLVNMYPSGGQKAGVSNYLTPTLYLSILTALYQKNICVGLLHTNNLVCFLYECCDLILI